MVIYTFEQQAHFSAKGPRMRIISVEPRPAAKDSQAFIQALEAQNLDGVRRVPKADLHCHATLGMRFSSLKKILGDKALPPPEAFGGLSGFFAWTQAAVRPYAVQSRYAEALISATIEDAIEDGVSVLEASFDLSVGQGYPDAKGFIALAARLRDRYAKAIRFKPEIGVKKNANPAVDGPLILDLARSGAFRSIDLYGPEMSPFLLGRWKSLYEASGRAGLKLKAHFGEFEGPLGLRYAIESLGVAAVQHGIGLSRSKRALTWAAEAGIACNVCPASNISLGAAQSMASHPIRKMFDLGIRISIATDDLVAFGSSVSEQYIDLYKAGVFTAEELDRIRIMGLEEGSR